MYKYIRYIFITIFLFHSPHSNSFYQFFPPLFTNFIVQRSNHNKRRWYFVLDQGTSWATKEQVQFILSPAKHKENTLLYLPSIIPNLAKWTLVGRRIWLSFQQKAWAELWIFYFHTWANTPKVNSSNLGSSSTNVEMTTSLDTKAKLAFPPNKMVFNLGINLKMPNEGQ